MRTVLICHEEEPLNRVGLPRWLASFCDLSGILVLREDRRRMRSRIQAEIGRIGIPRMADVLAFRLFYKLSGEAASDAKAENLMVEFFRSAYPEVPPQTRTLVSEGPNTPEAQKFIGECAPDIILARCKRILSRRVFSLAKSGTFVLHPGICPEYRNSHGCFWAMAEGDAANVGLTLLKVDQGVDTGPVYGYYFVPYDALTESHIDIQNRLVAANLGAIRDRLLEIHAGTAQPIPVDGRPSAVWGQPWLTRHLGTRRRARAAQGEAVSLLYHDVVPGHDRSASGFPGPDADLYKHTLTEFRRHMDEIAARSRLPVVRVHEIQDQHLLQPPLLLTFDDGGTGAKLAADVLEQHGWRGHFFVTTDYIGRPGFLTAEEIRGLRRRGHVIGSHSASHPARMSSLTAAQLRAEWSVSMAALAEILGEPVDVASVPGGYFTPEVADAAAAASIRYLFNSEPTTRHYRRGAISVFGRYCAQNNTAPQTVVAWIAGHGWSREKVRLLWDAKNIVKTVGGSAWIDFRKWFFAKTATRARPAGADR